MTKHLDSDITNEVIDFTNRFMFYDLIFNEYIELATKIHEGKNFVVDNLHLLSRSYRKNVQLFANESIEMVKEMEESVDTSLTARINQRLNHYIKALNKVFTFMDLEENDYHDQVKVANDLKAAKKDLYLSLQTAF